MDSKEIRKLERAIDSLEHHTDMYHENCDTCQKEVVPQARETLALLTTEPEPCDDALACAARCWTITVEWFHGNAKERMAKEISAYASQVADKRSEDLRAQVETLREDLESAQESMDERRGYCEAWEWKYKNKWDHEDHLINEALAATEPKS